MKLHRLLLGALLAGSMIANVNGNDSAADSKASAKDQKQLINQLYQREWVRLDQNGSVTGRVVVVEPSGNITGRIDNQVWLSRDGVKVYETKTGGDGVFELKGIQPGTYALRASGDYTFAAFALHVLPADAAHLGNEIDVYATTVGNSLKKVIAETTVPTDLEFGEDTYYREHKSDPIADSRIFNRDHQVLLRDGALVGRVSRPGWTYPEQDLTGTVAHVVKNGEVVAKATVGNDGHYRIEDIAPGIYDMVISGNDGFAAFRFQAVTEPQEPANVASATSGAHRFVSTGKLVATQVADTLNTELISQSDVYAADPMPVAQGIGCETCGEMPMVDSCGCGSSPVCGGGYAGGGGFAGGGGGFGGGLGGGLGGLLGLGGLAAGIVSLATSGDSPNNSTPIAP